MRMTEGIIAIAIGLAMLAFGRGRGGEMRPVFSNWLVLVAFVTAVELAFVGGAAAIITGFD